MPHWKQPYPAATAAVPPQASTKPSTLPTRAATTKAGMRAMPHTTSLRKAFRPAPAARHPQARDEGDPPHTVVEKTLPPAPRGKKPEPPGVLQQQPRQNHAEAGERGSHLAAETQSDHQAQHADDTAHAERGTRRP